jgi:hypothetical protein
MSTPTHVGDAYQLGEPLLQDPNYRLVLNSQCISHVVEYIPKESRGYLSPNAITGVLVLARDGDYEEIWATTGRAPYLLSTIYARVL